MTGTASMRWVRPDLTLSRNSSAFVSKEDSSCSSAGSKSSVHSASAARWTADGNTSFEDWPMLTWSLGWTILLPRSPPRISVARLAMTSLRFMLVDVPEPVW